MTDHTLAQADEVLTELIELVETARTLPMSSSCVVPRERTLDLLDALREVLPPEMIEARSLVAQRDRVLAEATERAGQLVDDATQQSQHLLAEATERSEQLLTEARTEAYQTVESAKAEQERLVSAASVQQAAMAAAEQVRAESEQQSAGVRAEAARYADKLSTDAQDYAAQTLSGLVETLQRLLATAENGRDALTGSAGPAAGADPAENSQPDDPARGGHRGGDSDPIGS